MVIEKELFDKIDPGRLPQHIAIIMDGNGRWAKKRSLPRAFGHKAGAKTVKEIIKAANNIGIKYLSLYALSTENWLMRPVFEVKALMGILHDYLVKQISELKENEVKLVTTGDISALPEKIQEVIKRSKKHTADCKKMVLNLCLNYGSRQEIISAFNKMSEDGISKIDEKTLSKYLYTGNLPDPDLIIRTSGEQRISNFLLWQIAYSEIYFTKVLWPDFNTGELYKAIIDYQSRERRFGGI